MLFMPEDARAIAERRIAASRADGCVVRLHGGDNVNLRFAKNSATSNGVRSNMRVSIRSEFGQRSGSMTVTNLDEAVLAEAQRLSEEIARLASADPEHMAPLGPQTYGAGAAFEMATADLRADALAGAVSVAINKAKAKGVEAAGYGETGGEFRAMATSNGLFAYERISRADLTVTARRVDGSWSGWASGSENRFSGLDPERIANRAVGKAAHSATPLDLEPGQYTVILEPSAVGELLHYLFWTMSARAADEGRSWLSRKGGGAKLGEALMDPRVTLWSDPGEPLAPIPTFSWDGVPHTRTVWIENGVVRNLGYSRYWAAKMGKQPLPSPAGIVMAGGSSAVEEMVRDTRRGILVTRFWYSNMLDPRRLLITGLTRDGNFLIENGRIAAPVRNFRFNESLITMLGNIEAIGPTERIHGGDLGGGAIAAPPLLVKSFNFSSRSRAI
jgi:predicted Zn-dependent protease